MLTIENEIRRAQALSRAKMTSFKGVTPRSVERNTLKTGDVFSISADYKALEEPVVGGTIINGKPATAKYTFVEVERGEETLIVRFFPSAFWKRRQTATLVPDPDDATKSIYVGSGDYVTANGTASTFVQGYADLDEAIKAMAGRKIRVTRTEILTMPYHCDSVPSSEKNKVEDSILTLDFVDEEETPKA